MSSAAPNRCKALARSPAPDGRRRNSHDRKVAHRVANISHRKILMSRQKGISIDLRASA